MLTSVGANLIFLVLLDISVDSRVRDDERRRRSTCRGEGSLSGKDSQSTGCVDIPALQNNRCCLGLAPAYCPEGRWPVL